MIGLSREFISISKSTGPLLVKDMLKTKTIKSGVFAFRFDKSNGASYMDLGTYESRSDSPIYWNQKQPYSMFWQLQIDGYQVNKVSARIYHHSYRMESLC